MLLDDRNKLAVIKVLSSMVSIGLIGMEEFTLVLVGIEGAEISDMNVSESFIESLFERVLG